MPRWYNSRSCGCCAPIVTLEPEPCNWCNDGTTPGAISAVLANVINDLCQDCGVLAATYVASQQPEHPLYGGCYYQQIVPLAGFCPGVWNPEPTELHVDLWLDNGLIYVEVSIFSQPGDVEHVRTRWQTGYVAKRDCENINEAATWQWTAGPVQWGCVWNLATVQILS